MYDKIKTYRLNGSIRGVSNRMFKVAICDDNEAICNEIEQIIEGYLLTEKIKYEMDIFTSGEELIESLQEKERFDLMYLDIELDSINGVTVGKYIREELLDDATQIAFISAKSSYALQLFQVRPIDFLVKPFHKKQVLKILEKTLELQGRQTNYFCYKSGKTEKRIPYKEIMYFCSEAKKIVIHMRDREDYFYGKLMELTFPEEDFLRIHKSFVVNKQYVVQFKFDSILLSNSEELPISRIYRKEVREKLKSQQGGDF